MLRTTLAFTVLLAPAAVLGRAETLPLIVPPTGYTYDQAPVSFGIFAPGLHGLTEYTIQFTVTAGPPGFPPDLTATATPPANLAAYPFPDANNFSVTTLTSPGTNAVTVTISDTVSGPGVDTLVGVNDQFATVVIRPGVGLTGPITVRFTRADFETSPIVGADLPPAFTIPQLPDQPPLVPVPAPPAWALFGLGGLCLACGLRKRL